MRSGPQLAIVLIVFATAAPLTALDVLAKSAYEPCRLLVKYSTWSNDRNQRTAWIKEVRSQASEREDRGWIGWGYVQLQEGDTSVVSAVSDFKANPHFADAQPNYFHEPGLLMTPNDPGFPSQWHLRNTGQGGCTPGADIDAVDGWDFQSGAPAVRIGMIDDGFDYRHPDLTPNTWINAAESTLYSFPNQDDEDGNGWVDDLHGWDFISHPVINPNVGITHLGDYDPGTSEFTHGTAVAGVVAAGGNNGLGVTGVSWQAQLVGLRVIRRDQWPAFITLALVDAIKYAIDNDIKITNNSYMHGRVFEPIVHDAIAVACDANMLFVVAAGNDGTNNDFDPVFPASYDCPCIISVGMTDCHDVLVGDSNPCESGAKSNYGFVGVDLAAPGRTWTTTFDPTGCPRDYVYANGCGTSVAAPQVTGAAALLWAQNPSWTYEQVKYRILATVDHLPSLWLKVRSQGRLNLRRALDNVAPAAVTNLSVAMGRTTAAIHWTAPGNNGSQGTADHYDLRMSQSMISEGNFELAQPIATLPPGPAGTEECADLGNVERCRTYYFALKTHDDAGNISAISNVVMGYRCDGSYAQYYCEEGLLGEGGSGEEWLAENSLFLASDLQKMDLYRFRQTPIGADNNHHVRLRMLGAESVRVDELSLGIVDHDSLLSVLPAGVGCLVGEVRPVKAVRSLMLSDGMSSLATEPGFAYGPAGEMVTVTLADSLKGASALVMESAGYRDGCAPDSCGILVQTPGSDGSWRTLAHIYPRKYFSKQAVDSKGNATLRLVFLGSHWIRSLARLDITGTVTPTALQLAGATHSKEGNIASTLAAGGASTSLAPGDTLELAFAAAKMPAGKVRDFFLTLQGVAASTSSAGRGEGVGLATAPAREFALGPARPNPSLGSVTIGYSLAQESPVSIRVYNVAGRLVRTLVRGTGEAGPHVVAWDARDDGGRAVPAGVYFYRMNAGGWQSQRKVVFLER